MAGFTIRPSLSEVVSHLDVAFHFWEALHFIATMKNPSFELNAAVLLAALQDWFPTLFLR
jgi:hypothetical protein